MLPRVTFRGLPPSAEIIEVVTRKAFKLSQVEPGLRGCHVVIEASPSGSQHPTSYRVLVQVQGGTEAARRAARHAQGQSLHLALGEVFRAVRRQLALRDGHRTSRANA
jgi:hypothetical protein